MVDDLSDIKSVTSIYSTEIESLELSDILPIDDDINNQKELIRESIHTLSYQPNTIQLLTQNIINTKQRIVCSIVCFNTDLSCIRDTLISLNCQDFDCIYLNLPGNIFNNSLDNIPEWVKCCCDIIFCDNSTPIIKLLPILDIEKEPNTIIVTVEVGVIYPTTLVKYYLNIFQKTQNCCYAPKVYKFKNINYFELVQNNNNMADFFDESYSVGYLRKFFKQDIKTYFSVLNQYNMFHSIFNIKIANYLQKYKINIKCAYKKNFNHNLCKVNINKNFIITSRGFNYKLIYNYYYLMQFLQKNSILYLKNINSVFDSLNYLIKRPYNIPFY